MSIYRYVEPFWMFTGHETAAMWIALGVLLDGDGRRQELYCRFLCPLGAALGLLSKLTIFGIKRWSECNTCKLCEKTCQWGAIEGPKIIMTECVRCDDCERLYMDQQKCPHWIISAKESRQLVQSSVVSRQSVSRVPILSAADQLSHSAYELSDEARAGRSQSWRGFRIAHREAWLSKSLEERVAALEAQRGGPKTLDTAIRGRGEEVRRAARTDQARPHHNQARGQCHPRAPGVALQFRFVGIDVYLVRVDVQLVFASSSSRIGNSSRSISAFSSTSGSTSSSCSFMAASLRNKTGG